MPESNGESVVPDYSMSFGFNRSLFKALVAHLDPQPKDRILDIGCGRGFYVQALETQTLGVIGIDTSEEALATAVTDRVEHGDATNLRFADSSFDKVFSLHTIEHVPNLPAFFSEIGRVLKPGGLAIIVYPWELFRGMQAIGAAIRLHRNPLRAGRIHVHRLTPSRVEELVANSPLACRESRFVPAMGLQFMTILDKPD